MTALGEELSENVNACKLIVNFLQNRFGVDTTADLVKSFITFNKFTKTPGQDLISYVAKFEQNYGELAKLGEELSALYRALFLLVNAGLSDVDYQIVTTSLDFKKETIYEDAKNSLRRHHTSNKMNSAVTETAVNPQVSANKPNLN